MKEPKILSFVNVEENVEKGIVMKLKDPYTGKIYELKDWGI